MSASSPTGRPTLAIMVGGGPAPGINSVIASATIEAINGGLRVIGLRDGFRWLADGDHVDELRRRAEAGDCHALPQLAGWLADHEQLEELRELLTDHQELLASNWGASQHQMTVLRLLADLGDDHTRQMLVRWLARMQQSAQSGSEHARQALAEWHDHQGEPSSVRRIVR